jgi:sugar lactone lactonase YvrE
VSYNDAKMDHFGRYWMGTFDIKETEPRGILYCISQDGTWSVGDSGFAVCNGPAFSPDGRTLYFSDSAGRRLLAYDVSGDTTRLANRRVLVQFGDGEGMPDGLTVDADGDIWCAQYGAAKVGCFAPDGSRRHSIALPCQAVTSCCFGGADLSTLYITTGPTKGEPPEAHGGGLFACRPGVTGLAEPLLHVTLVG